MVFDRWQANSWLDSKAEATKINLNKTREKPKLIWICCLKKGRERRERRRKEETEKKRREGRREV